MATRSSPAPGRGVSISTISIRPGARASAALIVSGDHGRNATFMSSPPAGRAQRPHVVLLERALAGHEVLRRDLAPGEKVERMRARRPACSGTSRRGSPRRSGSGAREPRAGPRAPDPRRGGRAAPGREGRRLLRDDGAPVASITRSAPRPSVSSQDPLDEPLARRRSSRPLPPRARRAGRRSARRRGSGRLPGASGGS